MRTRPNVQPVKTRRRTGRLHRLPCAGDAETTTTRGEEPMEASPIKPTVGLIVQKVERQSSTSLRPTGSRSSFKTLAIAAAPDTWETFVVQRLRPALGKACSRFAI